MRIRYPALDEMLRWLEAGFINRQPDPQLKAEALGTLRALGVAHPAGAATPAQLDVCRYLKPALANAFRHGDPEIHSVAAAFAQIAPHLAWSRRKGSEDAGAAFHDGHANAIIIGPKGLEERDDVWLGVSLMAPSVRYPVHRHPPKELYVVLSAGDWFREGDGWFTPGVGGTVYNPPDTIHSMRSHDAPLLAFWLLWSNVRVSL